MGAHRGGRIGGIFDAGLHTLSAIGRLTEDTDEDEEQRRQRIEAQEGGQAVGAALGICKQRFGRGMYIVCHTRLVSAEKVNYRFFAL